MIKAAATKKPLPKPARALAAKPAGAAKPASVAKPKPAVARIKPAVAAKAKAVTKPADKVVKSLPITAEKVIPVVEQKVKKTKLVRDSFTMPEPEYEVLGQVKKACLKAGFEVKKSELLRVGVALIRQLEADDLKRVLTTLTPLKAGRPKQEK